MKLEELDEEPENINLTDRLYNKLFKRPIKYHEYESVLISLYNMEIPPYLDKIKSGIRNRGTGLDRYHE